MPIFGRRCRGDNEACRTAFYGRNPDIMGIESLRVMDGVFTP